MSAVTCPSCGSERTWRDGTRRTRNGDVQRYICRECGYRFSETSWNGSDDTEYVQRVHREPLNTHPRLLSTRRICASQTTGAKNLVEVETRIEKWAAGATTKLSQADVKGKIIEYAWWMKKEGYRESTIILRTRIMKRLMKHGADILYPDSVKETIAKQNTWNENTKLNAVNTYTTFLKMNGWTWTPPIYKETRKLPFIPTELEIDQLIASCGKKTATFLQTLKETAMRAGESINLQWIDVNADQKVIRVTPKKNSNPRIFKVSSKLIGMLEGLPIKSKKVFGETTLASLRGTFCSSRRITAKKLQNPRILEIHFHTLRHWKATTLYHQTKDILYVMNFLGHKSIKNTLLYVQLADAIFQEAPDEFTTRVAKTVKGARALIEAGFDFVIEVDGLKIFRKRK